MKRLGGWSRRTVIKLYTQNTGAGLTMDLIRERRNV